MSSPSSNFILLIVNNRRQDGGQPYTELPGLMSGEIQSNSQQVFRRHMLKGSSADEMLDDITSLPDFNDQEQGEYDILMTNAAFALSAPCDDYDQLFKYMYARFAELDDYCLDLCLETTQFILESNPINPYLAFKQSLPERWMDLNNAFNINDGLLQMAVIFDDVEMVEKISNSPFASLTVDDFRKNVAKALAKTAYNPLSQVRDWADMTTPSMIEVEQRIVLQSKMLELGASRLHSAAWQFRENTIFKTLPEIGSVNKFHKGEFDLFNLASFQKDQLLRHIPGYHKFAAHFPEMIENCLKKAILDKDIGLISVFTNDLVAAGIPGHQILYRHIKGITPGEYLEKISDASLLRQHYIEDLLDFSAPFNPAAINAAQVLLGHVDHSLIDIHAKTDHQLQSAYAVTGDRKYLERMSEATRHDQLGADLGL